MGERAQNHFHFFSKNLRHTHTVKPKKPLISHAHSYIYVKIIQFPFVVTQSDYVPPYTHPHTQFVCLRLFDRPYVVVSLIFVYTCPTEPHRIQLKQMQSLLNTLFQAGSNSSRGGTSNGTHSHMPNRMRRHTTHTRFARTQATDIVDIHTGEWRTSAEVRADDCENWDKRNDTHTHTAHHTNGSHSSSSSEQRAASSNSSSSTFVPRSSSEELVGRHCWKKEKKSFIFFLSIARDTHQPHTLLQFRCRQCERRTK